MAQPIITQGILSKIRNTPHLSGSWYYLAAATLSACNRPKEAAKVFEYALETAAPETPAIGNKSGRYLVGERTRAALLKSLPLIGVAKGINALSALRQVTPPDVVDGSFSAGHPSSTDKVQMTLDELPKTYSQEEFIDKDGQVHPVSERGIAFWKQVYGKVSDRIIGNMYNSYPDLPSYVIYHTYSPLLSDCRFLTPKQSSLVIISALLPQDVNPQLKGHLHGAYNNGASLEEIDSTRELAFFLSQLAGVNFSEPPAKFVPKKKPNL